MFECTDDRCYVGETTRLYQRFTEHFTSRGGRNTSTFGPVDLVALYKVQTIGKFNAYNNNVRSVINSQKMDFVEYDKWLLLNFEDDQEGIYHHLDAENFITECMGIHNIDEWDRMRGGKYVRMDINYPPPTNENLKDLPLCYCGYPCDIKKKGSPDHYLYFRCAKKNIWEGLKQNFPQFEFDEPCKFYKEYTLDQCLRIKLRKEWDEYATHLKESPWLVYAPSAINHDCIVCEISPCEPVTYNGIKRAICKCCFKDNRILAEQVCKELKKKAMRKVLLDE